MIQKYFSTYFYRTQYAQSDKKKLLKELLRESEIFYDLDEAGRQWSEQNYTNGYTSYSSNLHLPEQSPYFSQLEKWIYKEVKKFGKRLRIDYSQGSLVLSNMWINMMGESCQHSSHVHPLSTISGTFYLNTPKGSGDFVFEDPRMIHFMGSAPRLEGEQSDRVIKVTPQTGELVLFESWLRHEVRVHRNEEPRVSVSFNYDWVWK